MYQKFEEVINITKDVANLDTSTLSCAAKVHYIIENQNREVGFSEIGEIAKSFNWCLSCDQITRAINLLENLSLITATKNA